MSIAALSEAAYAGVGYAGAGHGGFGHGGFGDAGFGHAGIGHAGLGPVGFGRAVPYAGVGRFVAPAPIPAPVAPISPVAPGYAGHGLGYASLAAAKGSSVPIPIGGGHDVDYYVSHFHFSFK